MTDVSDRFHETLVERPMRVWLLVVLRCSLEGGMHMHMVLACPTLTPPSHRNPDSAKSAELSVGVIINNAARVAGHGKALFPVLGKL